MLDNDILDAWDRESFLHPSTHLGKHARGEAPGRIISGGEGVFVEDRNGTRLLDAFAGLYCVNVGYGRTQISDAIAEQARAGGIEGIFCATDLLALGVLDRLRHERGLDIPGMLQLVGFDDIEQASWSAYSLSTIRQDVEEQASAAVELALKRLEQPDRPFETRTFGLEKVFRGTSRAQTV